MSMGLALSVFRDGTTVGPSGINWGGGEESPIAILSAVIWGPRPLVLLLRATALIYIYLASAGTMYVPHIIVPDR